MTLAEFFSMGGFGFFVWTSFGITAVLMISEILMLRSQRNGAIKRLQRMLRAKQRS